MRLSIFLGLLEDLLSSFWEYGTPEDLRADIHSAVDLVLDESGEDDED